MKDGKVTLIRSPIIGILGAALMAFCASAQATQNGVLTPLPTEPTCAKTPRDVQTRIEDTETLSRIRISRMDKAALANEDMKWVPSPSGSYQFSAIAENNAKVGAVTLLVQVGRPYLLRLDVKGLAAFTDVRWTKENRLYFRVRQNRSADSDVVLDVETAKIRLAADNENGEVANREFQENCKP